MTTTSIPLSGGRKRPGFWIFLLVALFALAMQSLLAQTSAAQHAKMRFNIAANSADKALKQLSAQSGVEVLFPTATVAGVRTKAVQGEMFPREALDAMLAGTPLVSVQDTRTGSLTVKRENGESKNVQRAAQPTTSDRPRQNRDAASSSDEKTVELSPFTVNAERDTGYAASSTLAGTRLRTELKDVAASVSVVTKDFMEDINATGMEDFLVYTLGTEVGSLGGNFSAGEVGANEVVYGINDREPFATTRIRGLGKADITRDYFLSDIPMDAAFLESAEVSRGPNSILFGLGSPAGIVNSNLIKANLRKTNTRVVQQYGSYHTHREVIDHNHVLIRHKLAVRFAATSTKTFYRIEEAADARRQGFFTATYRPFKHTTLRFNAEMGMRDATRVRKSPPSDSFSWWWDVGKPTYDPTTGLVTLLDTPKTLNARTAVGGRNASVLNPGGIGFWSGNSLGLIYSDPFGSTPGIPGMPGVMALKGSAERVRLNSNGTLAADGMASLTDNRVYLRALHASEPGGAFWRSQVISDPAIFDFYHHQIAGANGYDWANWTAYNVTLEQTFLDGNAGLELAWDKQSRNAGVAEGFNNVEIIFLDINTKLPDGAVNPNFLRPMTVGNGYREVRANDRDTGRATAYYNFDLRKVGPNWLGRLLGRHTLTGAHTRQDVYAHLFGSRPFIMGTDHSAAESGGRSILGATDGARVLMRVSYLGPSVANAPGPRNTGIVGIRGDHWPDNLTSLTARYYASPPMTATTLNTWDSRTFSLPQWGREDIGVSFAPTRTRNKYNSSVLVLHSRWLDETIISTMGWRKEEFETFNAGAAPIDPSTGLRVTDWNTFYLRPELVGSARAFNWSMAVHAPQFVKERLPFGADPSVYYNRSDNFRPGAQRYNLFGNAIKPEAGETHEWGLGIALFKGKFHLRATRYETTAAGAQETGLQPPINMLLSTFDGLYERISSGQNDAQVAGVAAWNAWTQTPGAKNFFDTFGFAFVPQPDGSVIVGNNNRQDVVVPTSDKTGKGWELEAVLNPTRNWRMAVNAARQEAIRNNTGTEFLRLMNDVFSPLLKSAAGDLLTGTGLTLRDRVESTTIQPLYRITLQDGAPSPELREWRLNAVTNYTFRENVLKGFGVGGAVRWQDRVVIGFPAVIDAAGQRWDVTRPYFGSAETNYDAWLSYERRIGTRIDWKAQLSVRNVGVGNKLIPVSAQPDGSIGAWRIAEPQKWTLSNTFRF